MQIIQNTIYTKYNYSLPNNNELNNFFMNYGLIYLGLKKKFNFWYKLVNLHIR